MVLSKFPIIGLIILNIFSISHEIPCDIVDSIRINEGVQLPNKSIIFNGIEYPTNQYYEVKNEGIELRGCICNIKKCIRLCCPHGSFMKKMQFEKVECNQHKAAKNFHADVQDENGRIDHLNLDQHFGYVNRVCRLHFAPDPDTFVITRVSVVNFCA